MLLDQNKFVVKGESKMFSSKKSFEFLDESGKPLGKATDVTGFFAGLFGGTVIEVRDATNNELVFTLARTGFFMKKDEVKDSKGEVVGRYKAKLFSLSGGFHIYDKDAKHVAEIQGKFFSAEYKFLAPDKSEMGSVSRTWGGLAKSLFTSGSTYGVTIDPKCANDPKAKMLILGASIALETIFKPKKDSGSSVSVGGDE